MTTPWTPGSESPNAGTGPSGSTPPAAPDGQAYPAPSPAAYPPPSGQAFPPPSGQAYPPPTGQAFPPPSGEAYPPPTGGAYPPPGAPGSYPPGMIPPPAAPAANKKRRYLITAIVLVIAAIAITFSIVHNQKTATTAANVGACIKITSATVIDPKTEQAPCTDPTAVYKVTETGGSDVNCDPNEDSYVQGKDTNDPSSRVCLRYNLAVGDCLDLGLLDNSVLKKVDCAAPTSTTHKLLSLNLDTADESKCPANSSPLPLVKRNIVYCFGAAS